MRSLGNDDDDSYFRGYDTVQSGTDVSEEGTLSLGFQQTTEHKRTVKVQTEWTSQTSVNTQQTTENDMSQNSNLRGGLSGTRFKQIAVETFYSVEIMLLPFQFWRNILYELGADKLNINKFQVYSFIPCTN